MSMKYIRSFYGVPAKRGARVLFKDTRGMTHEGVIVGSRESYLRVRMPTLGARDIVSLHPTSEVRYLPNPTEQGTPARRAT